MKKWNNTYCLLLKKWETILYNNKKEINDQIIQLYTNSINNNCNINK